jgi:hypothetical protein
MSSCNGFFYIYKEYDKTFKRNMHHFSCIYALDYKLRYIYSSLFINKVNISIPKR